MQAIEVTQSQREAVAIEAMSWINTPFKHAACVKAAGVDCAHVGETFRKVLGATFSFPPYYSPQWHLHEVNTEDGPRFVEIYIEGILNAGFIEIEKEQIQKGDVVLSKIGRVFCHGGIIINWPEVVQAESSPFGAGKVIKATANASWFLSGKQLRFFSWKDWH